jgi:hypothetical protein
MQNKKVSLMKYKSNSEPMGISYFRLNLLSYLQDTHPDKINDFFFIAGRGNMAAEAYSDAVKSGLDYSSFGSYIFSAPLKHIQSLHILS